MIYIFGDNGYKITTEKLKKYSFEIGAYRPPSEGGSSSLLIRATRNCPWNKCTFCDMYKGTRFALRPVEEIKHDIDSASAISDEIKTISWGLGYSGEVNRDVGMAIIKTDPSLNANPCFVTVFNWLYSGAKTVFLQDSNSLNMRKRDLIDIVKYLREIFPSLKRITSYARSKTIVQRRLEDLKNIYEAGLNRLHVGLETGDDELLKKVNKGATSEEHIIAGKKAKEAGFELSEYWMPDLGGRARWELHAKNTARVLNEINPDYIRSRPFVPRPGTPLYEEYERGEFHLSSPHERLIEIRTMIEDLDVSSRVCFDHTMNSWANDRGELLFRQDYEGYNFPEEKSLVLELIEEGLSVDESMHIDARDLIKIKSL
ncbi:MAG: radical SAM protein [Thermodesulfobacteriota bacterium]|nr:radical SAM protein [Thermodesulfobacteriota bacterium]